MSSRVNPTDLESEARAAATDEARTALIVRLLATGEWVHGVTAFALGVLWALTDGQVLTLVDEALARFAHVPGSADALRGLGFARLNHLADRAMGHTMTIVKADKEGGFYSQNVPDPQYAVAVKATEAAFALALGGDPEGAATDAEIEKILDELERARDKRLAR